MRGRERGRKEWLKKDMDNVEGRKNVFLVKNVSDREEKGGFMPPRGK